MLCGWRSRRTGIITDRPNAGGKKLLEVPGYKFQALRTNLPATLSALEVWRR